jgi:DNA modification methylase
MENQIFNESCLDTMNRMEDNSIDLVYDPFLGSGTTAKMAKMTHRKYVGSEINEDYFKIAQKRLSQTQEYLF